MINEEVKAIDLAKELNLHLKITVSVKTFDNYNPFYNIFDQSEEPCRRVVVLTKDEKLEEVYDTNPEKKINKYEVIDGNMWLEEYTLLTNPVNIDLQNITVDLDKVKQIKNIMK